MKKVPVREQDPKVRATNFDEVCLGYNESGILFIKTHELYCISIPAFLWIHHKGEQGKNDDGKDPVCAKGSEPSFQS